MEEAGAKATQHDVEQTMLKRKWIEWHDAIATDFHLLRGAPGPPAGEPGVLEHCCIRCSNCFRQRLDGVCMLSRCTEESLLADVWQWAPNAQFV